MSRHICQKMSSLDSETSNLEMDDDWKGDRIMRLGNDFKCLSDLSDKCQSIEDLRDSDVVETVQLSKDVHLTLVKVCAVNHIKVLLLVRQLLL